MTRWSWVIDQRRCIGCHACTTACKSENDVALGVFRTWVKQVDVGTFPEVRRHFAVLRCNHCEDAPCVAICPVTAMYQRTDGLVDFDEDLCIGCKACMQACPYDAIYMDPDTNTAAKCNFCSHRVDDGLLPACVVVCPVEALVFGDMDDPTSRASRLIAEQRVTVRRPEQRTKPKAFYIGAHEATLDPLGAERDEMYMWADGAEREMERWRDGKRRSLPLSVSPSLSARVSYDIPRQRTWGWKVSSYIWTKSIAAGAALLAALMGLESDHPMFMRTLPLIALAFLGLTGVLLVADLKRPERFWTILTRPQWKSWLAKGAVVITAYGLVLAAWIASSWTGRGPAGLLLGLTIPLALLTAVYTAFLFAQCEGRDLWQTRLLAAHLVLHALLAGALTALLIGAPQPTSLGELATGALLLTAVLGVIDGFGRHPTANGTAAARALTRGRQAPLFWTSVAMALIPALMFMAGPLALYPVAAALGLAGLWIYGHALILAGQGPPIS